MISLNIIIYIDISMIDGIPSNFSCWRSLNSYWIFDIFMYCDVCISTEDHRNCFFFLGQCSVVIMEDNHKESWNKVSLCFATLINKNKIKKMSFSLTLLLFNSKKKKKIICRLSSKKKKKTLKKVWNLKIEPCYITNVYIIYITNKGKKNSDIIYVFFFLMNLYSINI